MDCIERFLRDIVEVRVYAPKECVLPMPANLTFPVRNLENCIFGSPLLVLSLGGESGYALDAVATLKQKSSKKAAGTIYQHDLSATVKDNIDTVQTAIAGLETRRLYLVYKTVEGSYGLLYALPESGTLSCEVTDNTEHTLSVSYTCKSSYPAVVLTNPNFS
jgi:hypothetical protein